jgi:type I restriction enzyme M protein
VETSKRSQMIGFIWQIRDKNLRHIYERHEVGDVILPLVVLRRLDEVLAPTKQKVLDKASKITGEPDESYDLLAHIARQSFYNTSKFDLQTLVEQDPENILENTLDYLRGFSPNVRDIILRFGFTAQVERMADKGVLLSVLGKLTSPNLDLSPSNISNLDMGYLYEELLRLVADLSNKAAGDHFTPREVIALMVNLLVSDTSDLHLPGRVFTVYDPTCGTGGMLTEAERRLLAINDKAKVHLFGQELQDKSYAVCKADMLIKGQDTSNIACDDTLVNDHFADRRFDYVIANPPYGVDWAESKVAVEKEHERGFAGRFAAGLPGKSDGQLLFLQHMVAKAKTADEGGGRVAVVLNGSPLFSGDAGSGESDVRKWLFENDLVEAIIGLPNQLFYNTGIHTYVWVLTTKKRPGRQGMVQLIDARELFTKMGKSLGDKRNELDQSHISEITSLFESFAETTNSKVLKNEDFGYTKIVIDRPLRLRYEATNETPRLLADAKAVLKLSDERRASIIEAVRDSGSWVTSDRKEAEKRVSAWVEIDSKSTKVLRDAALSAVSVLDPEGEPVPSKTGFVPDTTLRDSEAVPLSLDIDEYIKREILPFDVDAAADRMKDKVGYEVPFTRIFYKYIPPRELAEIDADIKASQERIIGLLTTVSE